MTRPIRIALAGGWYHVTARGNEHKPINWDDPFEDFHPLRFSTAVYTRLKFTGLTPGQAVVFYEGDEVLGGGWIE